MTPEFFQLLDRYHKGQLSDEEIRQFRKKMEQDTEFRKEAEAYLLLMDSIKQHGNRQEIKNILDEAHDEMWAEGTAPKVVSLTPRPSRKYIWMTAAAASIAVVSIVGTLLITRSLDSRQTAYYKELRRNVQQIQRSQKQLMQDLAESKPEPVIPGKYSGTGFLVSSNGYIATSHHVVKESDSVAIENETYGRLRAQVIYTDAVNDISILKIVTPGFRAKKLPFTISNKEAELGEYVYTLGFPREDIVFGEGSVSASSGFRQAANAYQVSVPVNPGNSGGPLLNSRGDLIGIVSGVETETAGAAFAIKSSRLLDIVTHDAIDSLSAPLTFPKQNTIRDLNRVQQIKKWKEFVFIVRVYKEN
ncbi:S1C family serine protease [Fulvivirgaceae bacterium PWU4]|uniref:S1C family serine protease n=1 Tax=Chryseosolibacter histidini TaxID=2782349 RepID=A0AAP2GHF3_9BACT|nr:serine protease [Chryseosolibacter histidini]MBT1695976.1 S1C family serine protease [Chryseosolibacter histidini]